MAGECNGGTMTTTEAAATATQMPKGPATGAHDKGACVSARVLRVLVGGWPIPIAIPCSLMRTLQPFGASLWGFSFHTEALGKGAMLPSTPGSVSSADAINLLSPGSAGVLPGSAGLSPGSAGLSPGSAGLSPGPAGIMLGAYATVADVVADCERQWAEFCLHGHPITALQARLKTKEAKVAFAKNIRRQLLQVHPNLQTTSTVTISQESQR